jgi:hypothetical protein
LQNSSGNNHGKSIRIHVDNADMWKISDLIRTVMSFPPSI